MRIIDADALIGALHNHAFLEGDDRSICYNVIQKQPTIDAVLVIRCKDCTYYRQYADGRYDCDNLYGIADAHKGCFCSRAERKEE